MRGRMIRICKKSSLRYLLEEFLTDIIQDVQVEAMQVLEDVFLALEELVANLALELLVVHFQDLLTRSLECWVEERETGVTVGQ